ncbi:electron transfer flavoprotein subunit alpha/FixB family protein [Haloarchaeobius sp. HME9146]|uniref:electron transfer flavoprotein subunit alpha/FixB family protein n=1 Tax=Haloarchaeobius sp. HME9146 TaxID=2978732 RepID=UPI0021C0CFC7|nr:electron transfer flavoprotein subunit alpha/FixB family protein [Haloarchaeobius sp. HME9146]MCT9096675.1 electron transfer flavoprotein subunit alpha/FixB family protein [Haloarchaeobius sp. HME9146]
MPELDPNDYDISELGPALKDIEDVDELREILAAEEAGEDRVGAKKLIESRIEKFEDDGEEVDADALDPTDMTVADIGNAVRDIDEVDQLESLLEREEAGEDRSSAKKLIQKRIDDLSESDEEEGEVEADLPPEEKYPELNHPTADKRHVRAIEDGTYRDMWVYCETQRGELLDVSREMLGKARQLMDDYNDDYDEEERVVAVLIGDDVERLADECIALGADVVVYKEDERLHRFRHKAFTEIFCDMARWGGDPGVGNPEESDWRDYDEPRYVLFPATNNGRDLSALVQGELDSGLASDCSGLYIESAEISNPVKTGKPGTTKTFERILHMKRPDFSGFEYSTILCIDNPHRDFHPQGGSVIPGSFEIPEADEAREGEVIERDTDLSDDWFRVDVQEADVLDSGVDLTGHEVIVAMGRGIGDDPTLGMELGVELADCFDDADVGVTRGIVTGSYQFDGHVEQYTHEERQIGETGQIVEPKLYIAAGISGAVQHKVGMDESDTIIAINTDPDARIRDFSDYFIEGDLFDVLPRLIEAAKTGELSAAVANTAVAGAGGDDDD